MSDEATQIETPAVPTVPVAETPNPTPTEETTKTDALLPTIPLPPTASAEILKLHKDLVEKNQAFEQARFAFNEFIRAARLAVGIQVGELWQLTPNAGAFQKCPPGTEAPKA